MGKQSLGGHKENFVNTGTQGKGALTPQEAEPDIPVSVSGSPAEVWVGRGLSQNRNTGSSSPGRCILALVLLEVTNSLTIEAYRFQDWVASGQTTNREGARLHPSADNWIEVLLSMALPTRARSSFPHSQSLPSGNLHKPHILIHHRAERRNNYNPIIPQK